MTEARLFGQTPDVESGADISSCGRYRYRLWRRWGDGPMLGFVMLNPSTADASRDDPTIRRCIGFAKREGFGGVTVANMYAWRATKPADLLAVEDPFGYGNRQALASLFESHPTVVAAWGPKYQDTRRRRRFHEPDNTVMVRLMATRSGSGLVCLGVAKDGSPRHPLMVRNDQPLIPWPVTP